jgi:hypothetical protein
MCKGVKCHEISSIFFYLYPKIRLEHIWGNISDFKLLKKYTNIINWYELSKNPHIFELEDKNKEIIQINNILASIFS